MILNDNGIKSKTNGQLSYMQTIVLNMVTVLSYKTSLFPFIIK